MKKIFIPILILLLISVGFNIKFIKNDLYKKTVFLNQLNSIVSYFITDNKIKILPLYTDNISNTYYLSSSASKGIGNKSNSSSITTSMSDEQMKNQDFVNTLNNNKRSITDVELKDWIYNKDSYPTLAKNEVITTPSKDVLEELAELKITNKKSVYKIKTRVEGEGGTISGQNEDVYEEVKYKEDSTLDITAEPSDGYEIEYITVNGERINVVTDKDGNFTLDKFIEMTEDKEIVVKFINVNEYNFILTKIDKVTKQNMPGVKFVILNSDNNFVKDYSDAMVGYKQLIDGQEKYVVTTNANGQVKLKLPIGKYKIIEVQTLEGYVLEESEYEFEIIENTVDNTNNNIAGDEDNDGNGEDIITQKVELILTNQKESKVIVHYLLEGTGPESEDNIPAEELAPSVTLQGKEGDEYISSPKTDIEGYTLVKDENGKPKTPSNASGVYTKDEQHVYYYYNKKPLEVVVHHYLEGTKNELKPDEHYYLKENEYYETEIADDLLELYEFVEVVGETEGEITENKVVTYYYRRKVVKITTRVEVPEGRAEKGGMIIGEDADPYEYVNVGEDSKNEIYAIPDVGYKLDKITVNGKQVEFTIIGNKIQIDKFTNMTEDKEVVVSFVTTGGRVITHHYIEGTTEKVYGDIVKEDRLGASVKTSPVYVDGYKYVNKAGEMDDDGNVIITKTVEEGAHEVIYYYQKCSIITTDVIEHTEKYKDGSIDEKVKGGTITDEDVVIHEMIVGDGSNEETIEMTPTRDETKEYEIVRIVINGEEYDFTSEDSELKVDEEGKITIPKGFFKNVQGNIHVEVEFRRKSKVIVEYKDKETKEKIIEPTEIVGHADDEYTTYPKVIPGYEVIKDEITDENGNKTNANGNMFSDDVTVTYWYNKVKGGVIERHIAINHKGEEKEFDYKLHDLESEEDITMQRKDSKKYVPIDAPDAVKQEFKEEYKNIILVEKGTDEYTVRKEEIAETSDVIEVWYYYSIKNFNITTEVKQHTEKVVDPSTNEKQDVLIDGGTISGQDDDVYEIVEYGEKSKNEIVITPEPKYVVKQVILESTNEDEEKTTAVIYDKYQDKNQEQNKKKEITVVQNEDGTISLRNTKNSNDNSYLFENVTENKHIIVEFEKRKTKVFVKYVDVDTKEEIESEDMEGFIDDEYKTSEKEYENYILADPYPENAQGNFAEEDTTVTYYYTKQFNITTDVKEHNEDSERKVVDVTTENVENDDKVEGGQILVKGGTISGDDEALYEKVNRGLDNTKEVVIAPDQGYRIKYVKIEEAGKVVEELTMDELVEKGLVKEDGTVVLPAGYFKNMQADKHIVVEFERIPAKVVVKFVDKDTSEEISEQLVKDGFVNDDYITHEKQIPYFELVQEELPQNAEGKLEEETVVTYLYKKLNFNMKLTKELSSVCVNGSDIEVQNPKLVKVDFTKSELQSANIVAKYKITVENTEKVAGVAKVLEQIPEGFRPSSQMNITELETTATEKFDTWQQTEKGLALTTRELQPGETAEYEVILEWDASLGIIGTLDNVAKITETQNVPEFGETTLEDNEDSCTVLLTVKTGGREIAIAVLCFTLVGICAMVCVKAVVDHRRK